MSSVELAAKASRLASGTRSAPLRRSDAPGRAAVALRACRPRQWTKNVLLVAAPAAAGVLTRPAVALHVAFAVGAFCLLASATYLVNDVRDREQDRLHPRKRHRPVAAGELGTASALALAGALAIAGLALAAGVRVELALLGGVYLLLTASYSVWWRGIIGLDLAAIAAGFVIRAAAGGVATDVGLSRWFLLVTSFGAVFVVAAKRHAEIGEGSAVRATLGRYSRTLLRVVLVGAAAGVISAYVLWAARRPEQGPWYEITIMPVIAWLARYGILVAQGAGEAPEQLILKDRALLALTLAWTLLFLGGVYVGR